MSGSPPFGPYEGRPDRPIWFLVLGMTFVLVGLSIGSAISYSSVVVAQATVSIGPATTVIFQGTTSNGSLRPDGALWIALRIRIDNPSTRTLHLQLLAFSEWIEDGPAEAGMNESRRISDAVLAGTNGSRYFFQVFGNSTEVSEDPVLPGTTASYTFSFFLSRAVDSARFAALRNITDYWVSTTGNVGATRWNYWVRLVLVIDGIPLASSPTAAPYLRTIARIERQEGLNLAS